MLKMLKDIGCSLWGIFKEGSKEKVASLFFKLIQYIVLDQQNGNLLRSLSKSQTCIGRNMLTQIFHYITPVFCQMSLSVLNKSQAKWETNPERETSNLQIPYELCTVRTRGSKLSQASQIINTTPAAIHYSSSCLLQFSHTLSVLSFL